MDHERDTSVDAGLVRITEAAEMLAVSGDTVRRLMARGLLPRVTIPGVSGLRTTRAAVRAMVDGGAR